jgi:hypothetical protein
MWGRAIITAIVVVLMAIWLTALGFVLIGLPTPLFKTATPTVPAVPSKR